MVHGLTSNIRPFQGYTVTPSDTTWSDGHYDERKEDLEVVCRDCHGLANGYRERDSAFYNVMQTISQSVAIHPTMRTSLTTGMIVRRIMTGDSDVLYRPLDLTSNGRYPVGAGLNWPS